MITSQNDEKTYRHITLGNHLDVLLICDSKTDKSSAALAVNVGHFDDPAPHQGLAHLLEHMMFLGTKKFPDPDEYQKFIKSHGGHHNAWTGSEHTNYYFSINNQLFEQGLTRFSDFFVNPLLDGQWISKEISAVDSEYQLKYKDENRRFLSVLKAISNPEHPFDKFSVGNKDTLTMPNVQASEQLVRKFYNHAYCASKMKLVLLSDQSLDALESQAKQYFGNIKYRQLTNQYPDLPLYNADMQSISIAIQPERDIKKLHLNFSMPHQLINYHNKPLAYIGYILGHEGVGSLLSELKARGLANTLSAGTGLHGYNYTEFSISIALTQQGLSDRDTVIALVFKQIELIKSQGVEAWRYLEKHSLVKNAFDFQEPINPSSYTSHLATNLFRYEPADVIYGDFSLDSYEPDVIDDCLACMTPDHLRLITISLDQAADKTTRWYDTPYAVCSISSQQKQAWKKILNEQLNSVLQLPNANPFVVERLAFNAPTEQQYTPSTLLEYPGFRLWHMSENTFKVPKGHIYTAIDSQVVSDSARSIALCRLYVEMLHDSLAELTYPAELAGMYYDIYPHQSGLTLHVSGFTPKLFLYFDMIISKIKQRDYSQQRFHEIKQQLVTSWNNSEKAKPINRLFSGLSTAIQPRQYGTDLLKQEMTSITTAELNQFNVEMFKNAHLESYVHGDWSLPEIKLFGDSMYHQISTLAQPIEPISKPLVSLQGLGSLVTRIDNIHDDSAIIVYYQAREKSNINTALFGLFNQLVSPQFFAKIRTQQQLGYMCGTSYMPVNRHPGMILYIQSPIAGPQALLDAIDKFLVDFSQFLDMITPQQWQDAVDGLLSQVQSPDKTQQGAVQRFWIGISNRDTLFSHQQDTLAAIASIDQAQLLNFVKQTFLSQHADRLILSTLGSAFNDNDDIDSDNMIDDLAVFKDSAPLIHNT